jgi:serine phosphatase RsbU (regulator of sigma subunit)
MILFEKRIKGIKSKVMLTLGITILIYIFGYIVFLKILNKKNNLTEAIQKHEIIESINAVLQTKKDSYDKMVFDYSVFSWMINFIKHPDKNEGEMTISHPQNVGISMVQIYNLDKKLVYNDLSPALKDTIFINNQVLDSLYRHRKISFYMLTKYGLMQIFGSTVHPSDDIDRQTIPNGFVIFGKLWDKDYVNVLQDISNCKISLALACNQARSNSKDLGEVFFHDYKFRPVAHINISKINLYSENIKLHNNYFNFFFISFCFVISLIIYYTYNYFVIKPLGNIEKSLSLENTDSLTKIINRNDEFGKIAKLIGWFFKQRDEFNMQKTEIEDQNTKLHFLNAEMQAQNEEIVTIAEGLQLANKEITDSINYASFIQNAVLSPSYELSRIFPDHFIVYEPKNIVSGDFYWFKEMKSGEKILAVADCTGHGLSGSLLSMLGISFLNQITSQLEDEEFTASMVLSTLKTFLIDALHQNNGTENVQDGMHIALCIFDKDCRTFQYATAYHTICLVRHNLENGINELIEYKGNHIPVGIHPTDETFTNHIVELQKGDSIYMYSDGFPDQFGGPHNKKYKPSRTRSFLLSLADVPFIEQKENVQKEFEGWKGSYEQTDDLIVVGIKIPQGFKNIN